MDTINSIIKKAQDDLFPQLEAKIRLELEKKDKEWLIDQIIYLTCERHSLNEQKHKLEDMRCRIDRIRKKGYNDQTIEDFINVYKTTDRTKLEERGFLLNAPHMGLATIESYQRSKKGEELLEEARDMLYVALYGDEKMNVNLTSGQEELLTMILPLSKSDSLFFLKAVTETDAFGTWQDAEGVSSDDHTNNIGLQVEFNDNREGTIGMTVFVALNLINLLHVNEQILYARMEKIQRSSLQPL